MAMNYYANPAQAKFIDTYVPIPFDALMGLAENAKLERQANEKRLEDLKVKYGNFTSRSQADMNRWNQEVTKPLQDVASRIASNPDAIKGEEGRMLISSVINNMDYRTLDKLRQNSINLDEAYKSYDPRWQDNTLQEISTWDTASNGLYNKQNIPWKSLQELGNPFFKDLKPGLIPGLSNNKQDVYGVTQEDLDRIAGSAYNSLYSDPTFRKHMQRIGADRLTPQQQFEVGRRMITQDQQQRVRIEKRETRPEYLEAVRNSNRMALVNRRAKLANEAKQSVDNDLNRAEATKASILTKLADNKRFSGGQQLTNKFLQQGTISTGDKELDNEIKNISGRFLELTNKERTSKLTPSEIAEKNRLREAITNGIPRALGIVGEMDSQINLLKQKGLPESMSKYLDDARKNVLQYTLKMDPTATIGTSPQRRAIAEGQFNVYNKYFNDSLQRSIDYLTSTGKISDADRKDLIDRLGGYTTGAIAETNVDDETASQMGTGLFTERIKNSVYNSDSKAAQAYKETDKVLGVPATKAGVIRLFNYKRGATDRYVGINDNSLSGKLSNDLYNNPSAFNYEIENESDRTKFGSSTAPILLKSDGGKATVHVRNQNGRELPEFAAKQNVQVPVESMITWLNKNSQNIPIDKEARKQAINILKNELGYAPEVKTINGIQYFVLDGGNQMFGDPEAVISYNYNWKNSRKVDYKKSNSDAGYMDPGLNAWNNMFNATGGDEDDN